MEDLPAQQVAGGHRQRRGARARWGCPSRPAAAAAKLPLLPACCCGPAARRVLPHAHITRAQNSQIHPSCWSAAPAAAACCLLRAERIQAFTNTLANAVSTAGILGSGEAARYWAYHLSRSGFFMLQGLAGLLASRNAVGRGGDSPAVNRFEAVFRQAQRTAMHWRRLAGRWRGDAV